MSKILENLNDKQREAVETTEGAVLVLAGAGSGKTTVLVNRIAYIIDKLRVPPYKILAITFTNKAAGEMKERIEKLLGDISGSLWAGTFHSICVRILRSCIDRLGYDRDFVIYDTADTRTLMKNCMKEMNISEEKFTPRGVLSVISNAKNDMMDAAVFETVYKNDYRMSIIAELYKLYQKKLKNNNALDFDDIILLTVRILSENPDILERYQERFEYILVDEYQDTNNSQYVLINLLAQGHGNICVVGDDDQSIYRFRGANVGNILSFREDYPDAKIIKLEQNYRSTQNILDAANAVIANNRERMDKSLWTDKGAGSKIRVHTSENEYEEGRFIAREIKKHYDETGSFGDCAVLYRTNAQSRVIEEMLMREAVPYRVLAGLRFYDRKEIKDIVAYLRVIHNPSDDVSLVRIINEPKRKIGGTTVEKIRVLADENNCDMFEITENSADYPELRSAHSKLAEFAQLMRSLIKLKDAVPLTELLSRTLNDTGYMAALTVDNSTESQTRIENLEEFMSVAKEFENDDTNEGTLGEFLEGVSLISDIDAYDEDQDAAVLMTIHSAKGLEFPVVFLTGLEEGLFPGMRSIADAESIEEERRLCYVAITRAKEQLYITKTMRRTIYGQTVPSQPSRFYKEIPKKYVDDLSRVSDVSKALFGSITGTHTESHRPSVKPDVSGMITQNKQESQPADFKAGDIVEHRKFGRGVILSAKQFGKDAVLEIEFDSIGRKQLMAVFAKLKKL